MARERMAVDPALSELMLQTVTWQPRSSLNSYGEPTFGTAVTIACRVERDVKMVRTADGQEVVSSAQVYTDEVHGVTVKDQLTFTDGTLVDILSVATHWDEVGPSHEVIYI